MKSAGVALSALAVVLSTASPAFSEGILLDYRDRKFRDAAPAINAADKARISTVVASVSNDAVKALGKDFVVLGQAKGQLPKAGEVNFFLLSLKHPVASEPFPDTAAQVIVAIKGNEAVGTYTLPAKTQYRRLVGAVDLDGDRSSELLLEASFYNMGQLVMAVHAVKLVPNGTTSTAQSVAEVYYDGCGNPQGTKTRSSKTISLRDGKLVATTHQEKCG